MRLFLNSAAASALALATAAPAFAQYPAPAPEYRPTPEYQRQYQDYQNQQQQYQLSRQDYDEARREYERRLADWERERAIYDARWGPGVYARMYPRPVWDDAYWARYGYAGYGSAAGYREARRDYREARGDYERRLREWERAKEIYDRRWGSGAYARMYPRPVWDERYWSSYAPPPYAGYYGANAGYTNIRCDNDSTIAAGVIGALAGAVLGSNVAARNARTEGTVLGGVVGAAIGAGVGRAHDRYKCDTRGPYFTYDETYPYRESRYDRYASAYDANYYTRMRCRLAPAPIDAYAQNYRYVRVCPDENGRYRITG